jgi:type I restriction-modification system DNA methylase subunit
LTTLKQMLSKIYSHLFDRTYMSGVEREKTRVKATGEVFTPTPLVEEILDKMDPELFSDPTKTFLDPSAGDGQFLASVLYRKLQNGIDFETAVSTIYGVDLMQDNVDLCRERLLCGREDLRHIVEQNIVCADGLRYHYRFDGSHPYPDEEDEQHFVSLFDM